MSFLKFNINNKRQSSHVGSLPVNNGYYSGFYLGNSGYVNADVALQNSDIYSVIFQLSNDLANCEYTATNASGKTVPRTQAIIDNPMPTVNAHAFWQGMFAQLLLDGNAFAYRWYNDNGTDQRWEFLRPDQVQTLLLEDGSGLVYNITFDEPEIGFKANVPASDVIHFRLFSRNGGKTGTSPLLSLQSEANIRKQANDLTTRALQSATQVPGVLQVHKSSLLNSAEKTAHAKNFAKQLHNNEGAPVVLDDLEQFTPLEIKTNVAQLLQTTNWTSTNIAKAYGIPDSYLNGTGDQQSSVEQISVLYANALNRYAQEIAGELNSKLNATINVNTRPAVDVNGDQFTQILGGLSRAHALAPNQVVAILEAVNYFPIKVPKADFNEGGDIDNGNND